MKNNNITLVTNEGTISYVKSVWGSLVDDCFENIILNPYSSISKFNNIRMFRDTRSTQKTMYWNNLDRHLSYELTPYEQTLLLDCDYLIQNNLFDLVWDNESDLMINHKNMNLNRSDYPPQIMRLEETSILQYWATALYFKKTDRNKALFDLVAYIRDNYEYYRLLYQFKSSLFRNDFAFSIAIHMMNNWMENGAAASLPTDTIMNSVDTDELYDIVGINQLTFLCEKPKNSDEFFLTKTQKINVHVQNKYSIGRQVNKIINLYGSKVS
jgi:hypothetical protein